jgi:hypothetical protein
VADPGFTCVQDVYNHLEKPENQVSTELFVIKWDGLYPYLAKSRLKYLQDDRALAEVTYLEYMRRKRRPKDEGEEKEPTYE